MDNIENLAVMFWICISSMVIAFFLQFKQANYIVMLAITFGQLYPICVHSLILFYIKPYRDAMFRLLSRFFNRKGQVKTLVVSEQRM
jgi:hypothetical protein